MKYRHKRSLYAGLGKKPKKTALKIPVHKLIWRGVKKTYEVLRVVLGLVVILIVFSSLMTIASLSQQGQPKPGLPKTIVLYWDMQANLSDVPPPPSLAGGLERQGMTARDIVTTLDRAAKDSRIEGLLARMNSGGYSLAHIEEIRAALKRFRAAGKFAYIYSTSYGEGGGGLGRYYMASAFDEIWMQPVGVVSIPGINAEMPYAREALNKLGVTPDFYQRHEYKGAMENFTNTEMSEASRETTQALVNDIRRVLSRDIAQDRGFSEEEMSRLVDRGLFVAYEASESGLIDYMDYIDVLVKRIKVAVTGDPEIENDDLFVRFSGYFESGQKSVSPFSAMEDEAKTKFPSVGLIYAVGTILDSDGTDVTASGVPAGLGGQIASAEKISQALAKARADDSIKAVVLRIDSPGGSPTASERILRGVELLQQEGKSVIVSMGGVAASGGYWIASKSDRIFALPSTITGSIGVVGGKFSFKELWEKIGVNWDDVQWGKNSGLWSVNDTFTPSQAERINAMLDSIYDDFITRVAEGRDMTPEQVHDIAKGRVWSGLSASKIGLVDEFGGLEEALAYAAVLGEVDLSRDGAVQIIPRRKTPIEELFALLSGEVSAGNIPFKAMIQPFIKMVMMIENPQDYSVYTPIEVR